MNIFLPPHYRNTSAQCWRTGICSVSSKNNIHIRMYTYIHICILYLLITHCHAVLLPLWFHILFFCYLKYCLPHSFKVLHLYFCFITVQICSNRPQHQNHWQVEWIILFISIQLHLSKRWTVSEQSVQQERTESWAHKAHCCIKLRCDLTKSYCSTN